MHPSLRGGKEEEERIITVIIHDMVDSFESMYLVHIHGIIHSFEAIYLMHMHHDHLRVSCREWNDNFRVST